MLDIDHPTAWNIWKEATVNFNDQVYKVMNYMIKNRDVVCEINRNPTINYGLKATPRFWVARLQNSVSCWKNHSKHAGMIPKKY